MVDLSFGSCVSSVEVDDVCHMNQFLRHIAVFNEWYQDKVRSRSLCERCGSHDRFHQSVDFDWMTHAMAFCRKALSSSSGRSGAQNAPKGKYVIGG